MTDPVTPQPIKDAGTESASPRFVENGSDIAWLCIRVAFRIGLVFVVASVVIHFARNYFLYGGLADITPADFVPYVQQQGVPVMEAFQRFRRDKAPMVALNTNGLIDEKYLLDSKYDYGFFPYPYNRLEMIHFGHYITYDFTPGSEKWEVKGAVANGIIPVPPVTIPATQPQTRP